jgi:hypothetical protein
MNFCISADIASMVAQEFSVSSNQLSEKDGAPPPPRLFGGGRLKTEN